MQTQNRSEELQQQRQQQTVPIVNLTFEFCEHKMRAISPSESDA